MIVFSSSYFLHPTVIAEWFCVSIFSELYEKVYITFSSLRHTGLGHVFYLQCFAPAERFFCWFLSLDGTIWKMSFCLLVLVKQESLPL